MDKTFPKQSLKNNSHNLIIKNYHKNYTLGIKLYLINKT